MENLEYWVLLELRKYAEREREIVLAEIDTYLTDINERELSAYALGLPQKAEEIIQREITKQRETFLSCKATLKKVKF